MPNDKIRVVSVNQGRLQIKVVRISKEINIKWWIKNNTLCKNLNFGRTAKVFVFFVTCVCLSFVILRYIQK